MRISDWSSDVCSSDLRAVSEEAGRNENLITLTADIVAAHVTSNKVEVGDIPRLIGSVYDALASVGQPGKPEQQAPVPRSEERRVGKEGVSTGGLGGAAEHKQKNTASHY